MKVSKVYKKGLKDINEDAFVINQEDLIYAAIDGATGLNGAPGHIASQIIQEKLYLPMKDSSLYNRVDFANKRLEEEMIEFYRKNFEKLSIPGIKGIPKMQRSSSGMSAIQIDEAKLFFEYIHAGDCMLFLQYENSDIRTITYDLIQYLDQEAINEMVRLREQDGNYNLGAEELREKVKHILVENRGKLNTNKGYGIIDGSEEALFHLESGRVALKRVKKILLLSDGLLLPTKHGEEDNAWDVSARIAFNQGLNGLLEEVEKREAEDPDCQIYPRLKEKDDKTGVLLEL
ncbi:hypothetical protein [Virgibacillus sp. DJP39]|uniref:hypothetical protein n=1 Tax=Virgibacillus sp. DJP39 TaxID=3409790 RepID=UPI003BB7ECC4